MIKHAKLFVCLAIALSALAVAQSASAQCPAANAANFHRTTGNAGDENFHDYALLFEGARSADATCAQQSAIKLYDKLGSVQQLSPQEFSRFLSGAYVTFIMAAGLEIAAKGNLFADLDQRIAWVGNNFFFAYASSDPCGISNFEWKAPNSCMDDHAIAASGYAWVTAYYRLTTREWTPSRSRAITWIKQSFRTSDSICVHNPNILWNNNSDRGFCTGSIADLGTVAGARIISLNHGNQTPAYGLGLMTSIAAAFVGLDVAGAPINTTTELTANERKVIEHLWIEGQNATDSSGNFNDTCWEIIDDVGTVDRTDWPCGDHQFYLGSGPADANGATPYRAKFYPLNRFYTTYGFGKGSTTKYQFDVPDDTFCTTVSCFFGPGRKHTYLTLAYDWVLPANRPGLFGGAEYKLNILTNSGWRFTAINGGGSGVNANGTSYGNYETFWLYDYDSATLIDGSVVRIKTWNGQYLKADGGGGSTLSATGNATEPNTLFTIKKISGSTGNLIAHFDKFALRAPNGVHYVTAVGGGGAGTMVNATSIGTNETLQYWRPTTY